MNFLVFNTCEIELMMSQVKALYLCIPTQKLKNMADLHGKMSMFWNFFLNSFCYTQFCDKKNLTFVDCCDKILLNSLPNNIFQDSFNKILSQQLTHDRFYVYETLLANYCSFSVE